SCSPTSTSSSTPTSSSTATITPPPSASAPGWNPTTSTRAAATACGPTTPWRIASSPGARSSRPSTATSRTDMRRMPQRSPDAEAAPAEKPPHVSIVIPVYNEEKILRESLADLRDKLRAFPWTYEILVSENGSRDRTVALAGEIAAEAPEVRVHSLGEPNYRKARRQGILRARGTFVICDEIDLCDVDFYRRALEILERGEVDMVVGSKVMRGANDDRPWYRHAATLFLNGMLRIAVGFKGTDTHGLKA